jgi:hypothetical protein
MKPTRPSAPALAAAIGKAAGVSPAGRHVFRVLKDRMDFEKRRLVVPPSLTDIERETGYCRTTVRNALYELESLGWITRYVPTAEAARTQHERTRYELHIPGTAHMTASREARKGPDHAERRAAAAAYQREIRARHYTEHPEAYPDWPAVRPELVGVAMHALASKAGRPVEHDDAARAVTRILGGKQLGYFRLPDGPARYIQRAVDNDPLEKYLPARTPAQTPAAAVVGQPGSGAEPPAAALDQVRRTMAAKRQQRPRLAPGLA